MPRCPACFSPMTRITEDAVKSCTCPNCFGTWIQKIALLHSVRKLAADSAERTPEQIAADRQDIAELAATVVESNNTKPLRCNVCSAAMVKEKFHPMIPVIMDHCLKCDGIWLDVGEFSMIKKLWVELQTTTDPDLIDKRDKLAMAHLQWEQHKEGFQSTAQTLANVGQGLNILTFLLQGSPGKLRPHRPQ